MVAIQLTDALLGVVSCTENHGNSFFSYGFSSTPQRPIFGVPLRKQQRMFLKKQSRRIATHRGKYPILNAVIEKKEFEFTPSFDEYLKAMEYVKSVRGDREMRKMESLRSRSKEGQDGKFEEDKDRKEEKKKMESWSKREGENGKFGEVEEMGVRGNREMKRIEYMSLREKGGGRIQGQNGNSGEVQETSVRGSREMKRMQSFSWRKKSGKEEGQNGNFGEVQEVRDGKFTDKKIGGRMVKENHKKNSNGVMVSNFDVVDRAAFKSLEEDGDVYGKPRITRADMEERIQKLAKCLNGADIDMPEWMFSKMMRSAKIRFADYSILRLIQVLGKLGNWKRVLQVIEWIQSRERFKSRKIRYIYTAALDVLKKAKRPVEALNLFHAMQQQMSSYPDLVAYHCIAVTLGQAGYMKELFDVIDSMRSPPKKKFKASTSLKWDPRLEPDIVVYNAVLNACVHRKNWEGAFWVLQQLKQQHQKPPSTTYGLVMEVMFVCGKYNLVHDFFNKVQKSSIPNALTYKVLVNTLWKEGKVEEAISAVQDMERRGIVGTASLYSDLARCLCSAGKCQEALVQIDKICKVASKPLVVTYTGLIQASLDSGLIQDATYIFSEMEKFCSPNLVTYNIMLKAYVDHGMFDEAKNVVLSLLHNTDRIRDRSKVRNKVIPDIYTFNTILDACSRDQRWDDLELFYIQMLKHGFHFNAKRHLQMILDASTAGKGELLEATWKQLAQSDRVAPPLLVRAMFCRKLEQGNYTAALSCITEYPFAQSQVFSAKSWLRFFLDNSHHLRKDALHALMQHVSIVSARNDSPNVALQCLTAACKEYLRR